MCPASGSLSLRGADAGVERETEEQARRGTEIEDRDWIWRETETRDRRKESQRNRQKTVLGDRLYKRWARDNEVNQKISEGANLASWAEHAQDILEILRLPVWRGCAMEEWAGKGWDEWRAA